jgi:hypothetical protein
MHGSKEIILKMEGRQPRINYRGFDYTIKDTQGNFWRYRCSKHRSTKCKGQVNIHKDTGVFTITNENHICTERLVNDMVYKDVRDEMLQLVKEKAVVDYSLSANQIWQNVNKLVSEKYKTENVCLLKAKNERICNLVYNVRNNGVCNDSYAKIEDDRYLRISTTDPRLFLRYNFKYKSITKKTKSKNCPNYSCEFILICYIY